MSGNRRLTWQRRPRRPRNRTPRITRGDKGRPTLALFISPISECCLSPRCEPGAATDRTKLWATTDVSEYPHGVDAVLPIRPSQLVRAGPITHSANNWAIWAVLRSAIRVRRMQKDQLRAAHTIPPSRSERQASSRGPYCHKESAVVSQLPDLAGRESAERHWRRLCVSETSLLGPPIEARLNQPPCG